MSHSSQSHVRCAAVIQIHGVVQGVGFRPFVWQLATQIGVVGFVRNDAGGVYIYCEGTLEQINQLSDSLVEHAPDSATITHTDKQLIPLKENSDYHDFTIKASLDNQSVSTFVGADRVTCQACLDDVFNLNSTKYRYPFTNCTHCGPRLSIVKSLPYDRASTSMNAFTMCSVCHSEYDSPSNRRFHAQPNACPSCGPTLRWCSRTGDTLSCSDPIEQAKGALEQGYVVGIKGLGGYQLAVNATLSNSVKQLRERKNRPHKPFALMARDIDVIRRFCHVSHAEEQALLSAAGPIVVMARRSNTDALPGVAPNISYLGFMLPSTPLHHLLMEHQDVPLVMTSANLSGQPQCIDDHEAFTQLSSVADYFLSHNREIVHRVDDSVVQIVGGQVCMLRRARGYAPEPVLLPQGLRSATKILAMGGDLKNTFCLVENDSALVSQHIGDLSDVATSDELLKALDLYQQVRPSKITHVVCDEHPNYRSKQLAEHLCEALNLGNQLHEVQHHHGHVASCLGENQRSLSDSPVIGIVLDGVGFGVLNDSQRQSSVEQTCQLWGTEILLADYRHYQRLATLKPTPLPGGDVAMRSPWRNLVAHLYTHAGWTNTEKALKNLPLFEQINRPTLVTLLRMLERNLNSPLSSSCGRLFDAVAASVQICLNQDITYEGQAAIELQSTVRTEYLHNAKPYPFAVNDLEWGKQIDPAPFWQALLNDLASDCEAGIIAARFHLGLASVLAQVAIDCAKSNNVDTIALSGGVMQNTLLFTLLKQELEKSGLSVLIQTKLPSNDGGLSFGQALVGCARARDAIC